MTYTTIRRFAYVVTGAMLLVTVGCGDKVTVNKTAKGGAGESCTRRDDCETNLTCIDNRCISPAAANAKQDGGMMIETRGQAGESCTRRADCQSKLACVAQVCVAETSLTDMPQSAQGDRGESCQARNDCAPGLACVNAHCSPDSYDVTVQAKDCFRVECSKTTDCCDTFLASTSCPSWKTLCDGGDASYCNIYDSQCKCPYTCSNELCVIEDHCTMDTDCGSSLLKCFDMKCAQCKVNADCADPDAACVSGVCKAGCKRNEQCPLFQACQSGKCVDVGCASDRECLFSTQDPLSKCVDKKCVTPCQNDTECTGPFQVCDMGSCKFVGCETNEECRVFLGIQDSLGQETAVCRAPAAMK